MEKPVQLAVTSPSEERRKGCIEILEYALEQVKKGEVDAVMVITDLSGVDRTEYSYQGYRFPELIGNLERLKFKMLLSNVAPEVEQ